MQRGLVLSAGLLSALYLFKEEKVKCCGIIGIISDKKINIG
jgi:hypothetical protein